MLFSIENKYSIISELFKFLYDNNNQKIYLYEKLKLYLWKGFYKMLFAIIIYEIKFYIKKLGLLLYIYIQRTYFCKLMVFL